MIDLTPIFQAIITLLAALITYKLIPWIISKTTKQQQENLSALAKTAVYAAEQLYGANHGDEKLEYVKNILLKAGYNVNMDILRAAIEAAVHNMPEFCFGEIVPVGDKEDDDDAEEEAPGIVIKPPDEGGEEQAEDQPEAE